jgi:hypothetical protein
MSESSFELYTDVVSNALLPIFQSVETERTAIVPAHVRSFLESIIAESFYLREGDWQERAGVVFQDQNAIDSYLGISNQAVSDLLSRIHLDEIRGVREVTLISTLQQIHIEWCGIFPLCR